MRTAVRESELSTDGQTWDIPGSDAIHLRVMWPLNLVAECLVLIDPPIAHFPSASRRSRTRHLVKARGACFASYFDEERPSHNGARHGRSLKHLRPLLRPLDLPFTRPKSMAVT
jgi:hypothetical protein